jgi:hypothetical protein
MIQMDVFKKGAVRPCRMLHRGQRRVIVDIYSTIEQTFIA